MAIYSGTPQPTCLVIVHCSCAPFGLVTHQFINASYHFKILNWVKLYSVPFLSFFLPLFLSFSLFFLWREIIFIIIIIMTRNPSIHLLLLATGMIINEPRIHSTSHKQYIFISVKFLYLLELWQPSETNWMSWPLSFWSIAWNCASQIRRRKILM